MIFIRLSSSVILMIAHFVWTGLESWCECKKVITDIIIFEENSFLLLIEKTIKNAHFKLYPKSKYLQSADRKRSKKRKRKEEKKYKTNDIRA